MSVLPKGNLKNDNGEPADAMEANVIGMESTHDKISKPSKIDGVNKTSVTRVNDFVQQVSKQDNLYNYLLLL